AAHEGWTAQAGRLPQGAGRHRPGGARMTFQLPRDLVFNTQRVAAPAAFARDNGAASWLYLNGEAFATMEGGMSYADVRQAVPRSVNVVSDPPLVLDLPLARQHVAA